MISENDNLPFVSEQRWYELLTASRLGLIVEKAIGHSANNPIYETGFAAKVITRGNMPAVTDIIVAGRQSYRKAVETAGMTEKQEREVNVVLTGSNTISTLIEIESLLALPNVEVEIVSPRYGVIARQIADRTGFSGVGRSDRAINGKVRFGKHLKEVDDIGAIFFYGTNGEMESERKQFEKALKNSPYQNATPVSLVEAIKAVDGPVFSYKY